MTTYLHVNVRRPTQRNRAILKAKNPRVSKLKRAARFDCAIRLLLFRNVRQFRPIHRHLLITQMAIRSMLWHANRAPTAGSPAVSTLRHLVRQPLGGASCEIGGSLRSKARIAIGISFAMWSRTEVDEQTSPAIRIAPRGPAEMAEDVNHGGCPNRLLPRHSIAAANAGVDIRHRRFNRGADASRRIETQR